MRVVGGRFRGRALVAPKGRATRPTSDRARETLFNVLVHTVGIAFDGIRVIDLFAGSGTLGLEALSRGAAHVTFVDSDAAALTALRANVAALGVDSDVRILRADGARLPSAGEGDTCALAFLDPPYGKDLVAPAMAGLASNGWLAPGAVVAAETGADEGLAPPEGFALRDQRKVGAARIRIYAYGP